MLASYYHLLVYLFPIIGTKKGKAMKSAKDLTRENDMAKVARAVPCTLRYVRMTLDGVRGKRKTPKQQKVLKAWELRMKQKQSEVTLTKQNEMELIQFCKRMEVVAVRPQ